MARLEDTAYGDMLAQKKKTTKPTQSEINAIKDAAAKQQAINAANDPGRLVSTVTIGGAPAGYMPKAVAEAQAAAAEVNSTISEVNKNIADVNVAGKAAGDIAVTMGGTPWTPIADTSNNKPDAPKDTISADTRDAFALLEQTFRDYGLEELVPAIKGYMERNLGPNQATLELRKEPAYIARFKGNETRRAAGLNALSEAEYLALEDSYSQTLRAYGVQNYFGSNVKDRQKAMSDIIGNDISATEFKDRIDTVVTRVTNADAQIKETLKTFYDIKDEDLTSYFLNPKENLPKLQEKVTAAEIGAAAASQKLGYSKTSAEDLAKFGITKSQAIEGYSNIAELMPTASKLGEIYNDKYTQDTAEQEVFKGSASAKRKRQQLAEREAAAFSGSSGRMRTGKAQGNTGSF